MVTSPMLQVAIKEKFKVTGCDRYPLRKKIVSALICLSRLPISFPFSPLRIQLNFLVSSVMQLKICFFYFFINLFICLFIFGCVRSSLLHAGFLQLRRAGATLRCGARASHCGGCSCCGARALGTWASVVVARGLQQLWLAGSRAPAQQLWCTGLVALRHVGSSGARARTRVPCIGKQILNHRATREAPKYVS